MRWSKPYDESRYIDLLEGDRLVGYLFIHGSYLGIVRDQTTMLYLITGDQTKRSLIKTFANQDEAIREVSAAFNIFRRDNG